MYGLDVSVKRALFRSSRAFVRSERTVSGVLLQQALAGFLTSEAVVRVIVEQ